MKRFFTVARLWDVAAVLVIGFALWKIFIAPRTFDAPGAHPAPHAVYQRLDGGTFRIADQHGRMLFLDFYASWCEPCKIELPLVMAWAKKHPAAVVQPVDVGEPRSVAAAFARQHDLGDVGLDPQAGAQALFAIEGFPTIVVIDPTGHIRAKWEGLNPAIAAALTHADNKLSAR